MNEKSVIRQSFVVFVLIAVILLFVGVLFGSWNWLTGLVLGYLLSLVNFGLVMKICEHILALSSSVLLVIHHECGKIIDLCIWLSLSLSDALVSSRRRIHRLFDFEASDLYRRI